MIRKDKQKPLELRVNRVEVSPCYTIGEMYADGKFLCYTLEDQVRADGVKVFGGTAIPAGRYRVAITYSLRFKRDLPEVLDVPNFRGIRIHPGNTNADTQGCVLVGKQLSTSSRGVLLRSRDAMGEVQDVIAGALHGGREVWLTVGGVK